MSLMFLLPLLLLLLLLLYFVFLFVSLYLIVSLREMVRTNAKVYYNFECFPLLFVHSSCAR